MIRYSPVVVILGKGYRIQPIYIEDVADIVSKAVGLPQANNQIYELGGPESLTMQEILHTTAKILNRRKLYEHIPKFWGAILFSILEKIPGSIVTRSALDFITMNIMISEGSQKKVEKDFQIHISPLEKALKNYL
ncbi:MAG: hypothetical protein IT286_05115 [Proteobacteria bacterium]|nr:hypothetical protein [Pseudomonadota bacterium]